MYFHQPDMVDLPTSGKRMGQPPYWLAILMGHVDDPPWDFGVSPIFRQTQTWQLMSERCCDLDPLGCNVHFVNLKASKLGGYCSDFDVLFLSFSPWLVDWWTGEHPLNKQQDMAKICPLHFSWTRCKTAGFLLPKFVKLSFKDPKGKDHGGYDHWNARLGAVGISPVIMGIKLPWYQFSFDKAQSTNIRNHPAPYTFLETFGLSDTNRFDPFRETTTSNSNERPVAEPILMEDLSNAGKLPRVWWYPPGIKHGLLENSPFTYIVWWSLMIFPAIKLHVQKMFPLKLPVWWENPCFPADFHAFLEVFLAMFDCQRVESLRPFSMLSQADLSRAWTGCLDVSLIWQRWLVDGTLLYGYGSIPIDTFLVGWTSIYQLFWGSLGTRVLTHPHIIFFFVS